MKNNFLFPNKVKHLGAIVFATMVILGICTLIFRWEPATFNLQTFAILSNNLGSENHFSIVENNLWNEFLASGVIIGAFLYGFSKEKVEDELIAAIRIRSLVWATYINYGILLLAILFVYEFSFFNVLVFNMFTLLIFFILRFNWELFRLKGNLDE